MPLASLLTLMTAESMLVFALTWTLRAGPDVEEMGGCLPALLWGLGDVFTPWFLWTKSLSYSLEIYQL